MEELYKKIIETVENSRKLFIAAGLPPVETIDLYDGQPEEPEKFEFTCPALFVDYKIAWERGGISQKRGEITVEVHVLTHSGGGTEHFSRRLPEGLSKIKYYALLANLLETVETETVSRLALIAEEPIVTDYFCYHLLRFNAAIRRVKETNAQRTPARFQFTPTK